MKEDENARFYVKNSPYFSLPKVVALYAPRGSIGVTTTATNLAGFMKMASSGCKNPRTRSKSGLRVLAIDLDFQFGGLALRLCGEDHPNITDLVQEELSEKGAHRKMERMVKKDKSSNLCILAGPSDVREGNLLSPEYVEIAIDMAREEFDIIFLDCGGSITNPGLRHGLYLADSIILVTDMDRWAADLVKHVAEEIRELRKETDYSSIKLIINKASDSYSYRSSSIVEYINEAGFLGAIPQSDLVVECNFEGKLAIFDEDEYILESYRNVCNKLIQHLNVQDGVA